jgi:hypothetical protein
LEIQRKEVSRSGRNAVPRTPVYPTYTPPARSNVTDTYDSYEAEKNKSFKYGFGLCNRRPSAKFSLGQPRQKGKECS